MVQFDMVVNLLRGMYNDGKLASELAGTDSSDLDQVKELVESLEKFRDDDMAEYNEQAGGYFKLIQTISMLIGGGLMFTGVLGILAPVSLVRTSDLHGVLTATRSSIHLSSGLHTPWALRTFPL